MGRIVKLWISLGIALILVAALVISAFAAQPDGKPDGKRRATIGLVSESPLTVSGRGFAARERVTLRTAVNGEKVTKIVIASRTGGFRARMGDVDAECWPFVVSAQGTRGSVAALRRINIPPPCGVPITP